MIGWVFDRVPLAFNRYARDRRHGWQRALGEKVIWTKLIRDLADGGPWAYGDSSSHPERVRLAVTMNRSRLQDPDNRVSSLKPLIDALRRTGWLYDDSEHWLELHVFETKCKRGDEATWIVWDRIEACTLAPTPTEAT